MSDDRALSDDDLNGIREGMSAASMHVFMDYIHAIGRSLAEEDWKPITPSTTLRVAASYLAAVNVKLRPEDLAYVCDFLNVYADQLEDRAD